MDAFALASAAVERRKVRVPVLRRAGAFAKVPSYDLRHFGAPLPHVEGGRKKAGVTGAFTRVFGALWRR